jgi:hypothetical protein
MRLLFPEPARALAETGRRVGGQILVASAAARRFLALCRPISRRGGVGLIAGMAC